MTQTALRTVECPAGTVTGYQDGPVFRATGMRYARAERHREPVPEAEGGIIDATRWSPRCPQRVSGMTLPGGDPRGLRVDERCQYLSVTAPVDASPGEGLPVVVWIHGGSYETGAGDEAFYDPWHMVTEHRLVVVNVTYRLGPLGYWGGDGRPANLGLLDQLEAVRWVRRNIGGFGGDPDNVTLWGQSAGGDAVASLMVTEGARGLFRRVISMSPPLGLMRGRARMIEAMGRAAVEALPDVVADEDMIAARGRILKGVQRHGLLAGMPFGVEYGRHPLPAEDELDPAYAAVAPEVAVLMGNGHRETALFAEMAPQLAWLAASRLTRPLYEGLVRQTSRWIYGDGVDRFVARHRAAGGAGWRYVTDWGGGPRFQGAHVTDLALVFPNRVWETGLTLEGLTASQAAEQGASMRRLFADFARTGHVDNHHVPGVLRMVPG